VELCASPTLDREVLEVSLACSAISPAPSDPSRRAPARPWSCTAPTRGAVAFLAEALRDLAQSEPRASVGVIARYPGRQA